MSPPDLAIDAGQKADAVFAQHVAPLTLRIDPAGVLEADSVNLDGVCVGQ